MKEKITMHCSYVSLPSMDHQMLPPFSWRPLLREKLYSILCANFCDEKGVSNVVNTCHLAINDYDEHVVRGGPSRHVSPIIFCQCTLFPCDNV